MNKSLPIKFVPKGWGWERWIVNNDLYCGKQLFLAKGKRCSFHFHKLKNETFFVESGSATIVCEILPTDFPINKKAECHHFYQSMDKGNYIELTAGDVLEIPVGLVHQIIANTDVLLYEFSTHHEDSDSYRLIKGD